MIISTTPKSFAFPSCLSGRQLLQKIQKFFGINGTTLFRLMLMHWQSFVEFSELVVPNWIKESYFRLVKRRTSFENVKDLCDAFKGFSDSLAGLAELGFRDANPPPSGLEKIRDILTFGTDLCAYGEEILLLHTRLALSHWSENFIAEMDMMEHFERYRATGRLSDQVTKLVESARELYQGFSQVSIDDEKFLTKELSLPPNSFGDFVTARNLFSVGFEEAGFMFAGRGLEGTLRSFARVKQLVFTRNGKAEPASETDFNDLIEILAHARWRKDKSPIIDKVTRNLLHLVRSTRNTVAHPTENDGEPAWRELAQVAARKSAAIWAAAQRKRAGMESKSIQKTW